ncbi:MAG: tyrosine-type recombinase/integrase [Planctomycetes bacterium]|nr:tyrosine-type recombinase/integrase [Planctomycetota bacterium]
MTHSTAKRVREKPEKPWEGFPLFAHPSGQWARKIGGKLCYFGVWADPDAALEKHNREYVHLKDGRTPPAFAVGEGCTLRQLCNAFLTAKQAKMEEADLSPRSFRDYYATSQRVIEHFGKERRVDDLRPEDFKAFRAKLAKRYGATSLKNERNRVRILFNFALTNQLIDKPVSYGSHFDPPSARAIRKSRNEAGPKLFERGEILAILDAADVQVRAMVLLGVNGGLGNSDIANLPKSVAERAVETGWLEYPRPKTEVPRRIPLWDRTREALREALASRPQPFAPPARRLAFLTRRGRAWVRVQARREKDDEAQKSDHEVQVPIDALSPKFAKLLRELKINGRRGLGFYTLRHCFETQAGESRDQIAVDACMGHVDSSMAGQYRERISDERLRAVVGHVHQWLFGADDEK